MTTIDFARALKEAKGASMEALPIGDYDVEVAKSEATTSSNGKPMIKVTMKVVAGPYERRSVLNQFVMSQDNPVALSIFFRHMKAFGLTEDWFMALGSQGSLEPVANALIGRRARLTLGHRDWQGETRNEVKAVKPYTGAPGPAPTGPAVGGLIAPPTPPTAAPVPPPAPTPVATPAPAPAPAPVPAPAVATSVPPIPTPPAPPVPTATPTAAGGSGPVDATASSTASAPAVATSDAVSQTAPTPPTAPGVQDLPF